MSDFKESCGNCRFYRKCGTISPTPTVDGSMVESVGFCCRNPPGINGFSSPTDCERWCGEWRAEWETARYIRSWQDAALKLKEEKAALEAQIAELKAQIAEGGGSLTAEMTNALYNIR
jgi:hypothetical protein